MREIKFRAWHKEYKKMLYQEKNFIEFHLNEPRQVIITPYSSQIKLMQYTGLKDKNGKEIYEGDIVKYTFDNPGSVLATENGLKVRIDKVYWQDFRASFAVGNSMTNNDLFRYVRNGNRVEVIGNIYDNPELLGDGK